MFSNRHPEEPTKADAETIVAADRQPQFRLYRRGATRERAPVVMTRINPPAPVVFLP